MHAACGGQGTSPVQATGRPVRRDDKAQTVGAVNHVSGIVSSTFVAANTDPTAPIFNCCDYGIVADMDEVSGAMLTALNK